MAVKKVKKLVTKYSATGIFLGIDNNKLTVEDEKTGIEELNLQDLNEFAGRKVSFNFSCEKELDVDYDDEEDVSEEE